ncbi:MAG: ABC transporter permease [Defluviitaleaceae bacterium]|nr:ABC transporter permease [Defluviitaleaceae bacterium]
MLKGLKHVISFEYLNVVRRKAYLFSMLFYIVVIVLISFIPAIIEFFSSDEQVNEGAAIFYNATGGHLPSVDFHMPLHEWSEAGSLSVLENAVATGEAAFGLHFVSPGHYRIVTTDASFVPYHQLLELFIDGRLSLHYYIVDLIQIDGETLGVDPGLLIGNAGLVVGNIALFITMLSVISSGSTLMASIIKEKSSKIVELLFTSASPTAIILGKVIATALVSLTTAAIVFLTVFVISQFSTPLGDFVAGEGVLYGFPMEYFVYIVLFFVLAFISMSFIYAGLSATVSDTQESSTLAVIPMFVVIGAFYLSLGMLGTPHFISETFVNVISYVPFVSPFAMIARLGTIIMPTWEILLILGLNIIYTIAAALISARIYKMFIMLFGTKVTIGMLFKRLRKGV